MGSSRVGVPASQTGMQEASCILTVKPDGPSAGDLARYDSCQKPWKGRRA